VVCRCRDWNRRVSGSDENVSTRYGQFEVGLKLQLIIHKRTKGEIYVCFD